MMLRNDTDAAPRYVHRTGVSSDTHLTREDFRNTRWIKFYEDSDNVPSQCANTPDVSFLLLSPKDERLNMAHLVDYISSSSSSYISWKAHGIRA